MAQIPSTVPPKPNSANSALGIRRGRHGLPPDFLDRANCAIDDAIREIRDNVDNPINRTTIINSEIQACIFSMSANVCRSDHRSSGSLDSLEQTIICQRQALSLIGERHVMQPYLLHALGGSLCSRFEQTDDTEDINQSIECFVRAVQLIPERHACRPSYLDSLGISWYCRFRQLGNRRDLDQAIESQSQGVHASPENHPKKPAYLNNLGISRVHRFQLLGNLDDLNEAIAYQTQALRIAPKGYVHKSILLNNLGHSLLCRFKSLSDPADLDRGIEYGSQAVRLTPEARVNKPIFLINLASSNLCRFERTDNLEDVDEAIKCQEEALRLTPEDDSKKTGRLNSLGRLSFRRFKRSGDLEDLDKAIEHQKQTIQLTSEDHVDRPSYLSNLGNLWRRRSELLNCPEDIDKAIECGEEVVLLLPEGTIAKSYALMNLGCSWSRQFALLQLPTDIEKAIKYQAQATQLIPDGHADKQMYLNILGNSWAHRFRVFGDEGDLDKAIQLQVQVVELTPEGHPDRPRNLSNLKNLLAYRHQQFSDPYDFKSGNCIASDGYGAQPHNSNPGHAYIDRSELFDLLEDPESKLVSSQSHAQVIIADPETQIECTLKWAACSVQLGLSPFNACQKLFKLIPRLTWVGVAIQRRYSILIKIGDLVAQAAAWAISVGYYDLAIEWLEKGRSVVWKQLLQLRTPFEDLTAFDPRLSNHLKSISAELEGVGPRKTATAPDSTELPRDFENQESHQLDLAAQWELLLAEARQLPGLDDFLQPQNVQELKKAASDGPLVIINTHPSRCDALIIFPGHEDVMHVPLDRFSHAEAIECRTRMVALIGHRGTDEKRRGFKCYNGVPQDPLRPLSVLWSNVVAPILEALAITHKQPYDELPHIKWCATGALSFLPLHAAGLYDGKSPNAFDLIVSSYTPTLSALLPRNNNTHEPHTGILAVGQASSPGFPPLPKTVEELAIIRKHAGSIPFQQLDGPLATVEATRKAIQNHSWVHIACHASQNRADPSQSAFHLHDGELTLETIAKRGLKNKGLAFLSACQTATGDDELPDEATHLAAGMLMAGFPSVIATLWSIMDEDAPGIAEDVYAELMHDGKMDHTKSARALHKAVGELRKKVGPECIGRWAPFVHIGV